MTAALNWFVLLALVLAGYLSTLNRALISYSRHALARKLEARGKPHAGAWLTDHMDTVVSMSALLRTIFRLALFAIILVDFVGFGEDATLTVSALLWAGAISVVLLWLFTTVLSSAVARYAGIAVIDRSMPLLHVLAVVGWPLTHLIALVDEMVKRLTGANLRKEDEAEAQLLRSIEETHLQGGLDEDAAHLLENVVEFGSTDVGEVMTPRTDIDGLEKTNDIGAIREFIIKAGHSRIPVFEGNLDNILGILYVKDLIPFLGKEPGELHIEKLLRKPIIVPETKPVGELLADFQKSEVHMAIVIDEYGGTAGLVTIEDVLEEIVGEIHDEHEPEPDVEPMLTRLDESHAEVDGRYRVDDLNEELELEVPEEEEYDTVAGFLLTEFGRVPETGETIETHNARFTITAASETHIQKVRIELLEPVRTGNGRGDLGNGK